MARKVFTDESLETFVDEIKAYVNDAANNALAQKTMVQIITWEADD